MGLSGKPKYRRTRGHPRISIYCVPLGSISSSVCPDHPTTLTEKGLLSDEPPETQLLPHLHLGDPLSGQERPSGVTGDNGLKTSRPSPHHSSHPGHISSLHPGPFREDGLCLPDSLTGHLSVAGMMPRPRSLKIALSWRPYLLKSPRDLKDH